MENRELYERMLSGTMYNDLSTELVQRREQVVFLTNDYNSTYGKPKEVREALLRNLLKGIGENVHFEPNFRCEFGFNITIGNNFFANFDCIMLDGNLITIGDNVLLGPRVGLYTANHALDARERIMGGCYAHPIVIEDNVWIGAGVHIMGGVTIGRNSVIGAGSVVTKDVPENVIAAGVPCKVIREITDFYKLDLSDILVIYDDISLEPGMLRLRTKGSAGGHNGMKKVLDGMKHGKLQQRLVHTQIIRSWQKR